MYTSTYIPVNIHRTNCAIYSNEKSFPEDKLVKAYQSISGKTVSGVVLEDGYVTFVDAPEIRWTLPEIYLAYQAYDAAMQNNFSFYIVSNEVGIPQLFISKSFKGHRILVNAFTMQTTLLTDKQRVNKVASLIDKTASGRYCIDLFNTMRDLESGSAKFLPAIMLFRDTDEECLVVSPMTTILTEITNTYGADVISELRSILSGETEETESFKKTGDKIVRTDSPIYAPLPIDFAEYLVDLYDKIRSKKNNYLELLNEEHEPELYFSTNQRYLVNAKTFECIVIKNQHTKLLLSTYAAMDHVSKDQLAVTWMLAKTE